MIAIASISMSRPSSTRALTSTTEFVGNSFLKYFWNTFSWSELIGHQSDLLVTKVVNLTISLGFPFSDFTIEVILCKITSSCCRCDSPWAEEFFAVVPELVIPIIFLTQFWIFASLIISTKQILNLKSNFKSLGVVFLSFLIIAIVSVSFVMSRMEALPISSYS